MKNRILITGSNSYIGSEIINYLSKYNYNLIATYRKNKNEFKSKKVKLVKFDLKKKSNLNKRFGVRISNGNYENKYYISHKLVFKIIMANVKYGKTE